MKKIILLTLSTFFVVFFWQVIHLPFEIPDEQSHFATTNFLVTHGRIQNEKEVDLTLEQQQSEYIFGVMTDGTNRYAFNPSYHLPYSTTQIGQSENEILGLNTPSARNQYTIHQGAVYPPLYYALSGLFYKTVESKDLLTRTFVTRWLSILLVVITIYFYYLIGRLAWDDERKGYLLATLGLFYPMTSYLGAGINPDNLHNLLFTIFVYLCFKLIKSGLSQTWVIYFTSILVLDLLTKPQAYIMIPLVGVAYLLTPHKSNTFQLIRYFLLFLGLLTVGAGWYELPKYLSGNPYLAQPGISQAIINPSEYLAMIVKKFLTELIVWYWGVFKWTTIIMPRLWWWVGTRIILFSTMVNMIFIVLRLWRHRTINYLTRLSLFALLANLIYVLALVFYDYQYYQIAGKSLGFQARYFMPLLSTQIFVFINTPAILFRKSYFYSMLISILSLFFISLSFVAIWVIVNSYYDISSFTTFIIQASQYKPWYAKGLWWYLWVFLYTVSMFNLSWLSLNQSPNRSGSVVKDFASFLRKLQKYVPKKHSANT